MPSTCASIQIPHHTLTEPFPSANSYSSSTDGSIEDNASFGPSKPRSRRSTGGRSILHEIAQEEEKQRNASTTAGAEVTSLQWAELPKRTSRYPRLRTSLAGFTAVSEESAVESTLLSAHEAQKKRDGISPSPRLHSTPIHIPSTIPGRPDSPRAKSYSLEKQNSATRRSRRTTSTTSSWSPASAFLSQWNRAGDSVTGPDDEGQEIGDAMKYIIGRQIGYGGFSVIKEAFSLDAHGNKAKWAVKIVRKHVDGKSMHENDIFQLNFEHEWSIWRTLNHAHILSLVDVYEDSFATYCITHLHPGGTLHDLVRSLRQSTSTVSATSATSTASAPPRPQKLPLATSKRYIYELASALHYLHHEMQMVHRDVKLENCLLRTPTPPSSPSILLADFGMADYADAAPTSTYLFRHPSSPSPTSPLRNQAAGSLHYAAPEILAHRSEAYAPCVDVWAFGIVCYALLTLKLPFDDAFQPRVGAAVLKGEYDVEALREAVRGVCGGGAGGGGGGVDDFDDEAEMAVEMVKGCLTVAVHERWDIRRVLACRFLEGCAEVDDQGC